MLDTISSFSHCLVIFSHTILDGDALKGNVPSVMYFGHQLHVDAYSIKMQHCVMMISFRQVAYYGQNCNLISKQFTSQQLMSFDVMYG